MSIKRGILKGNEAANRKNLWPIGIAVIFMASVWVFYSSKPSICGYC